jgi:hypothetical protein
MADLACVLASAGLAAEHARFARSWPSCGGTPAAGDALFLAPDRVEAAARRIALGDDLRGVLLAGLRLFADRPALRAFADHARWMFASGTMLDGDGDWPMISREVHEHGPLFWAYVVLACAEERIALNQARGIDEAVTCAGFADLGRWLAIYHRTYGHWGFDRANWLHGTVRGTLIQLGRLQCHSDAWSGAVRVFRHRRDRQVAMLMVDGATMRSDGRFQGVARLPWDPAGWTATFTEGADGWRGCPVDQRGRAQRAEVHLPAGAWEAVLAPGDPVWYVHIPPSGPLAMEACRASLLDHHRLLPQWFPGHAAKAFISFSWLFDAQLADYLPADSNLVRFLRAFHLHPHFDPTGDQILERALGRPRMDWRECVPTSSLQRAVVEHYRSGGTWCKSGAVLFADEIATAFA